MVKITKNDNFSSDWRKKARGLEWEKNEITRKQKKHRLSNKKIAADQETAECIDRIKRHSNYYKIRRFRRGLPGQYVLLGLDGNIWIRMEVLSGELVCSYNTEPK